MKIPAPYPNLVLCFWLGFLPAALSIAFGDRLFTAFTHLPQALHKLTVAYLLHAGKISLKYGIIGGFAGTLVGYLSRNIQPHSRTRCLWLALVVPEIACITILLVLVLEAGSGFGTDWGKLTDIGNFEGMSLLFGNYAALWLFNGIRYGILALVACCLYLAVQRAAQPTLPEAEDTLA